MSDGVEGALCEARQLLALEAERRGVSGKDLVDQLAREGRHTGRARRAQVAAWETCHLPQWLAMPQWVAVAIMVDRRGVAKSMAAGALPLATAAFGDTP